MSAPRALFLTLMLLMVLPWGAWAGVGGAWAHLRHAQPAVTAAPAQPGLERPRLRCRTATLPGSPCGTDMAPPPARISLTAPQGHAVFAAEAPLSRSGHAVAPPVRPPRSC